MDKNAASPRRGILSYGEIAWDRLWLVNALPGQETDHYLYQERGGPGGCALNTAIDLAGLGERIYLAGNSVGSDPECRAILQKLRALRVQSEIARRSGARTPFCQVFVEKETGRRSFILAHRGIQDFDSADRAHQDRVLALLRRGRFGHAFVQPYTKIGSLRLLKKIAAMPLKSRPWILIQDVTPDSPFVRLADAVQISIPDQEVFSESAIRAMAGKYFSSRTVTKGRHSFTRQVFVTAGARGVGLFEKGAARARLFPGTRARRVVDTTGCGDAFRAGLMAGLARGLPLEKAIRLGTKCGAWKAGIYGSFFETSPRVLVRPA
ncbi:MAG: PfkB family carbohydrate kinase [Bdellovibrionota bacterium]